jgi:signal transduction histidine kinase
MADALYENPRGLKFVAQSSIVLGPVFWLLEPNLSIEGQIASALCAVVGGGAWLLGRGLPRWFQGRINDIGFFLLATMGVLSAVALRGHEGKMALTLAILCWIGSAVLTWSRVQTCAFVACIALILFGAQPPGDAAAMVPAALLIGAVLWITMETVASRTHASETAQEVVAIVEDAAAAERASAGELKDLDRLKTGFYSSIVEGLRGPLTLMLSPLDSMLSGDVGSFRANQIEYLETVRRNALKVLRLSDDLVDLSHLESGLLRLQTEDTNISGLLQEIVDHSRIAADSKGIQIELNSDPSVPELAVDIEKLERALIHLVSTAIQYTSQGGHIRVDLAPSEDGASIEIQDNGAGLPPDWIAALAVSDGDQKWLPPRSAEGVGLVLAREIVALHRGTFEVSSKLETGTTFNILLPRGEATGPTTRPHADAQTERIRSGEAYRFGGVADAGEAPDVEHAPSESKATKVLVVDDNPEILQFTKSLLSQEHAVFVASNGQAGLELARAELPDVIITDTRMPKLDGTGLIRALREDPRLASVPTIILTARNQVADREAARESGADMVMDKPFNPRELRSAISDLFAKQHRQASNFMNEQARSFEIISAGLAHEMHNPLAYIKNAYFVIGENAKKVIEAARDPELSQEDRDTRFDKARDKIDKMLPVADRGIKKVEQLVALMRRYAREGYSSDAVDMPIDQSISDVLAMIAPKDNKDVSIEADLNAPDAIIKGVPEELQQAITNLTQNAVDAVGKGGHVWVRTRPEARSVRIEVADDGPGIPREAMARIFTPFFTTKEVGKGMGLGLTITRQVIKQHGGTLDVDSTPGQGTTFTIRLPLASEVLEGDETSALEQAAAEEDGENRPTP